MKATIPQNVIGIVTAALSIAWAPLYAPAQEANQPIVQHFWQTNAGLEIQASLSVFGPGSGVGSLSARMLASEDPSLKLLDRREGWTSWPFYFDEPLPLSDRYLNLIRDRKPFVVVQGNQLKGPELAWYLAYNQALDYANRDNMDLDKFKKGAQANLNVDISHLLAQPERYRGKIITVRGELMVVREEDAPRLVGPDFPKKIYTGYILKTKGVPVYTIVFTQLPDEITLPWGKESLDVTFHGYFLSLVRFPGEKGSQSPKDVISPYLVGRTLIVHGKAKAAGPDVPPASYSYTIIASTVGVIVAIFFLGAMVNLWLRRGDRRIQSQLASVRDKHNPFNLEAAESKAPPAAQDGGTKPKAQG